MSSITIPGPVLMTRVWSENSCLRAPFCAGVKFGVTLRSCSYSVSFLTLSMYFSIAVEAKGGDHACAPPTEGVQL